MTTALNIDQIKTSCRKTRKFISFFIICLSLSIIADLVLLVIGFFFTAEADYIVNYNEFSYTIIPFANNPTICQLSHSLKAATTSTLASPKAAFACILLSHTLSIAGYLLILLFLRKLFGNVSRGQTPFTTDNAALIKKTAVIMLAFPFIYDHFLQLSLAITGNNIDGSLVIIGNHNLKPILLAVLMAAIIFSLGKLFEYGCYLQTEYDETI